MYKFNNKAYSALPTSNQTNVDNRILWIKVGTIYVASCKGYKQYNNRKQRKFLLMVNKLYTVTFSIHHSIHNHNLSIVAIAIIQMSQDGWSYLISGHLSVNSPQMQSSQRWNKQRAYTYIILKIIIWP